MKVQKYIQNSGLESLEELGISVKRHETLPLMILNYSQIDSPKTHSVVRECRGLVLHTEDLSVVARAFPRFFNLGEIPDEDSAFEFEGCEALSKEDGSLMLLYWFDGHWRINTRNGFGDGQMEWSGKTWEEGFCNAMGIDSLDGVNQFGLYRDFTYVLEFCSPWNKIVRRYEKPTCFLLAVYCGETELIPSDNAKEVFTNPQRFTFRTAEDVRSFLKEQAETDPTFEGVVLLDRNRMRLKVKSEAYLRLHRIRGNNGSIVHPKHLLPFVLSGEESELLTYFPEVREEFSKIQSATNDAYHDTLQTWREHREIEDQKSFALAVKEHQFSSVLFTMRKKHGCEADVQQFRSEWQRSEDLILKKLF